MIRPCQPGSTWSAWAHSKLTEGSPWGPNPLGLSSSAPWAPAPQLCPSFLPAPWVLALLVIPVVIPGALLHSFHDHPSLCTHRHPEKTSEHYTPTLATSGETWFGPWPHPREGAPTPTPMLVTSNPPLDSSEPQFICKGVMIMPNSRDCWKGK